MVRAVQATSVELDYLGLTALKLSWIQVLRKHLELNSGWKKVMLRRLREKFYLGCTFEALQPVVLATV